VFRGCDLVFRLFRDVETVLLRVDVDKTYYILTVNQCLN
jgi:hypothetical protein